MGNSWLKVVKIDSIIYIISGKIDLKNTHMHKVPEFRKNEFLTSLLFDNRFDKYLFDSRALSSTGERSGSAI